MNLTVGKSVYDPYGKKCGWLSVKTKIATSKELWSRQLKKVNGDGIQLCVGLITTHWYLSRNNI